VEVGADDVCHSLDVVVDVGFILLVFEFVLQSVDHILSLWVPHFVGFSENIEFAVQVAGTNGDFGAQLEQWLDQPI